MPNLHRCQASGPAVVSVLPCPARGSFRNAVIGRATGWLVKACGRNAKASGHEGKE